MDRPTFVFFVISQVFILVATLQINGSLSISTREPFNCTKPGYQCNGCEESYYCIPQMKDYFPQLVERCSDTNKTCLESTGQCTTEQNLACDKNVTDYVFLCSQKGIFPHPFKCNEFYICSKTDYRPEPEECPVGYNYNVKTTLCDIVSDFNECDPIAKPCKTLGELNSVRGHMSMYYICLVQDQGPLITPQIIRCPRDELFNGTQCIPPFNGIDDNGRCLGSGYFYNPSDCTRYYQCSGSGENPIHRACSSGPFNPITSSCTSNPC